MRLYYYVNKNTWDLLTCIKEVVLYFAKEGLMREKKQALLWSTKAGHMWKKMLHRQSNIPR